MTSDPLFVNFLVAVGRRLRGGIMSRRSTALNPFRKESALGLSERFIESEQAQIDRWRMQEVDAAMDFEGELSLLRDNRAKQNVGVRRLQGMLLAFGLAFHFLAPSTLQAQDVASLMGVVTDPTGAVVRDVTVSLANDGIGVSYKTTTNRLGFYSMMDVPPGPGYKLSFYREGFKPVVVTGLYLNVSSTRTENACLSVGNTSQTVEVSAAGRSVTLNTTDSTVGNNFEVELVNELPVQLRDTPSTLFALQPGVTSDGSTTGARTDQNHVTLDGLDTDDSATGEFGAVVAMAPVDSIQEFRGVVASPLSSADAGGGGQFQMVTKSGTNRFHAALFEYHRDTATEANTWFNNNFAIPRAPLIRNQFGGNIGGPILRDKLFFFLEYNGRRDDQGAQVLRTVPLDSFRNGNVSYIRNIGGIGDPCFTTSRQDTTPDCIGTLNSAQVAAMDPARIGFNTSILNLINQRYPHANDLTAGDGVNTGGFRFNAPVHLTENGYVSRVDYNANDTMKIWGRVSVVSETQGDNINYAAPIQFPGDPLTHLITNASYAFVVGHTWIISSTKTNQFIYGETRGRFGFPAPYNPQGTSQFTLGGDGTGGSIISAPYSSVVNAQSRVTPIPIVRDDFSWIRGSHNFQFGGFFKFIKTSSTEIANYDQPVIGLGGNLPTLNASFRPADIQTDGSTASYTYDSAFALALGRFAFITSNYNYDRAGNVQPQGSGSTRDYRYYETEGYFGDTWKVTPSLTLSYGVHYQWYSVPYETNGLESVQNVTFDQYVSDRVTQSMAGRSGNNSLPFISYTLGGKANHGPGLYHPSYKNFAPRFSFAANPAFDPRSVFNGGVGIVYDHTIINAVQSQQDQYSYLFQSDNTTPYGVSGDPATSLANDPRFTSIQSIPTPPAAPLISRPYQPYVDRGSVPFGLANGQAYDVSIDPNLRNPYSIVYNLGFQHEFARDFILKMDYVGRLGRRLLAQADANQVIDFPDVISGQQYSDAFGAITRQVRAGAATANLPPQAWFENVVASGSGRSLGYPNNTSLLADNLTSLVSNGDFADFTQALAASGLIPSNVGMGSQFSENTFFTNKGFSAYNGLLATLHKNASHGLQFDLNYTWSHSIDNVSLIANSTALSGYGFICDVLRPRECRGNSDFDVTHYVSGDFLYRLPLGRVSPSGSAHVWLNEIVGGWDVSGLPNWHSGNTVTTNTNAYVAGYANDAPAIFNGNRAVVSPHAHKNADGSVNLFSDQVKALQVFTGPVGFTIGSRNNLRGPNYFNLDTGLAKTFPLVSDRVNLKFRADAFNAFNHPSFATPSTSNLDITGGTFGQITATATTPRVMQFALRLEF